MSRSYKKNPIYKDHDHKNFFKRYSNKVIRQADLTEVFNEDSTNAYLNNKEFKKVLNSWEVHDEVGRWSEEDARQWYREMQYELLNNTTYKFVAEDIIKKYPTEEIFIKKYWTVKRK